MRNIFSYGSNLDISQMQKRCPSVQIVGPAVLEGWRLLFAGHSRIWQGGVATIEKCKRGKTYGVVYQITKMDMMQLDRYEGNPYFYKRQWVEVKLADSANSEIIRAETYILQGREPAYPTQVYYNTISRGYIEYDLDLQALLEPLIRINKMELA